MSTSLIPLVAKAATDGFHGNLKGEAALVARVTLSTWRTLFKAAAVVDGRQMLAGLGMRSRITILVGLRGNRGGERVLHRVILLGMYQRSGSLWKYRVLTDCSLLLGVWSGWLLRGCGCVWQSLIWHFETVSMVWVLPGPVPRVSFP